MLPSDGTRLADGDSVIVVLGAVEGLPELPSSRVAHGRQLLMVIFSFCFDAVEAGNPSDTDHDTIESSRKVLIEPHACLQVPELQSLKGFLLFLELVHRFEL